MSTSKVKTGPQGWRTFAGWGHNLPSPGFVIAGPGGLLQGVVKPGTGLLLWANPRDNYRQCDWLRAASEIPVFTSAASAQRIVDQMVEKGGASPDMVKCLKVMELTDVSVDSLQAAAWRHWVSPPWPASWYPRRLKRENGRTEHES